MAPRTTQRRAPLPRLHRLVEVEGPHKAELSDDEINHALDELRAEAKSAQHELESLTAFLKVLRSPTSADHATNPMLRQPEAWTRLIEARIKPSSKP